MGVVGVGRGFGGRIGGVAQGEWGFVGVEVADAILDRIAHSAHSIELTGESVRKMKALSK